jgi:putative intracellular protease/amidase
MSHSAKLDTIDFGDSIDAIYLTGGHGVDVDYINNPVLKAAIEKLYASGKIVAADCHGPIGLVDCVKPDGSALAKDKMVTGFADSEEKAVQMDHLVPFLLETRFKEQGATYEKTEDWGVKVCVDGNLVTGQNPASSEECAKAVIKLLK